MLLKVPGTKRSKLEYDVLLSTSAFKFNLRRYKQVVSVSLGFLLVFRTDWAYDRYYEVGRCRLTLSNPS